LGGWSRRGDFHIDLTRTGDFTPRLTLTATIISRPAISSAAFLFKLRFDLPSPRSDFGNSPPEIPWAPFRVI
jgi:hypothetical protein